MTEELKNYTKNIIKRINDMPAGWQTRGYIEGFIYRLGNNDKIKLDDENSISIGEDNKYSIMCEIYENINTDDQKIFYEIMKNGNFKSDTIKAFEEKFKLGEYAPEGPEGPETPEGPEGPETPEGPEGPDSPSGNGDSEDSPDTDSDSDSNSDEEENSLEGKTKIEKYIIETEKLEEEYNKEQGNIELYKNIMQKIKESELTDEVYTAIKGEIDALAEDYPAELKQELLENLDIKKNAKLGMTEEEKESIKQENLKNSPQFELTEEIKAELEQKNQEITTKLEEIKAEKESLNNEIQELEQKIVNEPENTSYQEEINLKKNELDEKEKKETELNEELDVNNNVLNAENENDLSNAYEKYLEYNIKKYTTIIEQELKEKIRKIKDKIIKIESKNKRIIQIEAELQELEQQIESLENKVDKTEAEIKELADKKNEYNNLTQEKESIKEELSLPENKLETINGELNNLRTQREDIEEKISNYGMDIKSRRTYKKLVEQINSLIDSETLSEEEINQVRENINNSNLEEELKQDLNQKLDNTLEKLKNKNTEIEFKTSAIDDYTAKSKEKEEDINKRKAIITEYKEIENEISLIGYKIKAGMDPNSEEIKTKVNEITGRINEPQMPKPLKEELNEKLRQTLLRVKNNKNKFTKWAAGLGGLLVGGVFGYIAGLPIALGAAAVTLTGTIGTKIWSSKVKKDKMQKIMDISKPTEEQLAEIEKMNKKQNILEHITWALGGATIGLVAGGALKHFLTPKPLGPEPLPQNTTPNFKVGDSTTGMDLKTGYDQSSWAINGNNAESLNQGIMNDGQTVIRRIMDSQGHTYASTQDALNAGKTWNELSFDLAKGTQLDNSLSRAWVNVEQATRPLR